MVIKNKKRPKGAQPRNWFKTTLKKFKKDVKRFGGDFMTLMARTTKDGEIANLEDIPYMGAYINDIDNLGRVEL